MASKKPHCPGKETTPDLPQRRHQTLQDRGMTKNSLTKIAQETALSIDEWDYMTLTSLGEAKKQQTG